MPTAVSCARLLARWTFKQWGLSRMVDDAELVVSELATNAVKATGVVDPKPRWTELRDLALIRVGFLLFEDSVIVEVWDRDKTSPVVNDATLDLENGRGLFIVTELCARWNYYLPTTGGKVVWGRLDIPPFDYTEHGLPKRPRGPWSPPSATARVTSDPDVLRRVADGLRKL